MERVTEITYVQVMPQWARMAVIVAVSGLPHYVVRRCVNEGWVRARKSEADKPNAATVYHVGDVLEWLEKHAQTPPPFKLPEVRA